MDRYYCPRCEEPLVNPKKCDVKSCGWDDVMDADLDHPTHKFLLNKVALIIQSKYQGPFDVQEEATQFVAMMRPERDNEKPHRSKSGKLWEWPYSERIIICLHHFIDLDRSFQELIEAAAKDGIYWMGENSINHFRSIIYQTKRQRKMGSEAYKTMAIGTLDEIKGKGKPYVQRLAERRAANRAVPLKYVGYLQYG